MKFKVCSTPMRSKLFQAIACSLIVTAAPVALADSQINDMAVTSASCTNTATAAEREACQIARFQFVFGGERRLSDTTSAAANTVATANYTETAQLGDADSWKTEEFQQDWGLEAMNAHHAYARGLTGSGIRIGLFDSGVGLNHTEFAGKNHQGLKIGSLLEDGSRCMVSNIIGGDTACFATDGGRAQVEAQYWDPELSRYMRPQDRYILGRGLGSKHLKEGYF